MMSENARSIVLLFDESHTRIQTISELLLISCIPRPVFTRLEDTALSKENFVRYRDKVMSHLNKLVILSRDVSTQVHTKQIQWKPFCQRTQELTSAVIRLSELSAHIAYLMAVSLPGSEAAVAGPVAGIHQLTQADLDIKFSCAKLKRSRISDLQPHLLVDLCSVLTKSLTCMTEICRQAAEKTTDANDQDQFKLCIKVITSTVGCLVSSIKSFKHSPTETHLQRVVTFCDPVTSASGALLSFASEENFRGKPAELSAEASEKYKSIIGLCMSIASANIQMCRAVRDLVYASSSKRHQDRMSLCVESITRTTSQLRDLLLSHEFIPKPSQVASTDHDNNQDRLSTSQSQDEKTESLKSQSEESDSKGEGQDVSHSKSHSEFDDSKISTDNRKDVSEPSSVHKIEDAALPSHSPLPDVDKNIAGEDDVQSLSQPEVKLSQLEEKNTSEDDGKESKPPRSSSSSPSSSSSSRPSSVLVDAAIASIVSQCDTFDSPEKLSPHHLLSSQLSISSSSLVSSSSINMDPEYLLGSKTDLAEDCGNISLHESGETGNRGEKEKSPSNKDDAEKRERSKEDGDHL